MSKLKLAHQESIAQARLVLNEAKTELAEFRALTSLEEMQEVAESERIKIAEEELVGAVSRAQATLTLGEEAIAHEAEVKRLEISQKRQKAALQDQVYESEYRASFDGVLQLTGALSRGAQEDVLPREVRVSAGDSIAVIKNDSAYRVIAKPLRIDYEGVSRSKLFMIIDSSKGEAAIQANFSTTIADPRKPGAVENWVFSVLEEDVADVKSRDAGSQALASIYLDLGEKAWIVPKSILLERLPEESRQPRSWSQVLSQLIPEGVLVAEGRGALAIRRRKASSK